MTFFFLSGDNIVTNPPLHAQQFYSLIAPCCLTKKQYLFVRTARNISVLKYQYLCQAPDPSGISQEKPATLHHYKAPAKERTQNHLLQQYFQQLLHSWNTEPTITQRIYHELCSKESCSITHMK